MVVADQVQGAMRDEMREMRRRALAGHLRLPPHHAEGERDFAEVVAHAGEAQHVGRLVLAAMLSIQALQLAVIGQSWRALGLEVVEELIPSSLISDRPYRATFPGLEFTAQGSGGSTRSSGLAAMMPCGTGISYFRKISWALYS